MHSFPQPEAILKIKPVLSGNANLAKQTRSKEEQLLSERKRCSVWGITHYQLHRPSGLLVFPAASNIFYGVHAAQSDTSHNLHCNVKEIVPEVATVSKVRINPLLHPTQLNLIAFTCSRNVYVCNTDIRAEVAITSFDNTDKLSECPLSAGAPSYVMQEEFFRFQG